MEKIAIFPGSFDPFTTGHKEIVDRAYPLFDRIIISIGFNSAKTSYFPLPQRVKWITSIFADKEKIMVDTYEGLTVDFCKKHQAKYILRGVRNSTDYEYEKSIAQMNKSIYPEIESILLLSSPELSAVNSTIVRDIIRHGGDASQFLPKEIKL